MDERTKGLLIARAAGAAIGRFVHRTARAERSDIVATPWMTQDRLQCVGVYVSMADLAERTLEERTAAVEWAEAVERLDLEPAAIELPPRPEWLPGRDKHECTLALVAEFASEADVRDAHRRYQSEWKEPGADAEADDFDGFAAPELPDVDGDLMAYSLEDFERVCRVFMVDQPDEILRGVLEDGARLARLAIRARDIFAANVRDYTNG